MSTGMSTLGLASSPSGLSQMQARIDAIRAMMPGAQNAVREASGPSRGSSSGTATAFDTTMARVQQELGLNVRGGATGANSFGEAAVELGKQYLGIPYLWGGTDPEKGLDCSGLVQLVYRQLGVELPRVSRDQAKAGTEVPSLEQARPGDLIFFGKPVDHVGIFVGDGKFLEAPSAGKNVRIHDIWDTPTHIRRVAPGSFSAAGVNGLTHGVAGFSGDTVQQLSGLLTQLQSISGSSSLGASVNAMSTTGGSTRFDGLFTAAGSRYGVNPALLKAIAATESSFNPNAVSPAGARGLMQLMPGTAAELGVDAMDPAQAVSGAARLMAQHLKTFDGSLDLALAAYNAGPGNVRKYGGVPPFTETENYIQRVRSRMA